MAALTRRRGACLRVTWIQPEDLVGHELRQAREEGKDVDAVEERWFAAGGAPAPARGASQEPVAPELRALALELLDELDGLPRPLADDEPDGFDEILAAADPAPARAAGDLEARIAGAWLGRAAGCVLGKPVESIPREGIREIAQATGNWPVARLVHGAWASPRRCRSAGRGTARAARRASPRTSTAFRRTTTSTSRCSASSLLERHGTGFDSLDVAKLWLDYLPAGPHLHGGARRAAEPPRGVRCRRRRRRGATRSASGSARGCASTPTAGPRRATRSRPRGMAWEDARLSHTANGVYAAMFMAAAHAASLAASRPRPRAPTSGSPSCPARSRLAEALRAARELARRARVGGASSTSSYARYGDYHWVHAINNTALVAAALYASTATSPARSAAVVQGGLDTDTNGAAVGSVLGALAGRTGIQARWVDAAPRSLLDLAPGLRRRDRRRARAADARARRGTVAGVTLPVEQPRDPWSPRPIDLPTRRPARRARSTSSTARRSSPRPTTPPTGRRGARRSRAGAPRRSSGSATTAAPTTRPEFAWTRRCFSVALVVAVGRAALRPRGGPLHARPVPRRRRERSSAATTASCSGTPTR